MLNLELMSMAELDDLAERLKTEKERRDVATRREYYGKVIQAIKDYQAVIGAPIHVAVWNEGPSEWTDDAYMTINDDNNIEVVI